jgi:hypothetical protein
LTFWTPFWNKYKQVLADTGNTGIEDLGKLKTDIAEEVGDRLLPKPTADNDFVRDANFQPSRNFAGGRHFYRNTVNPFDNNLQDDIAPGIPNNRYFLLFEELKKYNQGDLFALIRTNFTRNEREAGGLGRMSLANWKRLNPQDFMENLTEALVDKNLFFDRTRGFGVQTPHKKDSKIYQRGTQKIKLHREGQRKIFGRGIQASERPRHYEFGKYRIHADSLDKGILNVKFKSLTTVPKIPVQTISSDLKMFIQDITDSGKVNKHLFNKLDKSDKDLFYKIAKMSDIDLDFEHDDGSKEELERYNLVKGQIMAGNNSSEVLKEMQYLIMKFMNKGILPRQESVQLLYQLSVLS